MNTDGLNLGLPLQGTAGIGSSRPQAPKGETAGKSRGSEKPESFSDVLSTKSAAPAPRTETPPRQATTAEGTGSGRADPENETPSVKDRTIRKSEIPKGKKAPTDREAAMLEFMDSMESEFGIPPERIVEAMALLPQDKMLQAPEETASQVIGSLDLPPAQAEEAMVLYSGLLGQLARAPLAPAEGAASAATMSAAKNAPLPLTAQEKRAMLHDSLDRMNQKFFLQDTKPVMTPDRLQELPASRALAGDALVDRLALNQREGAAAAIASARPEGLPESPGLMVPARPAPGVEGEPLHRTAETPADSTGELMKRLAALGASAAALDRAVQKPRASAAAGEAAPADFAGGTEMFGSTPGLEALLQAGTPSGGSSGGDFMSDDRGSSGGSGLDRGESLNPDAGATLAAASPRTENFAEALGLKTAAPERGEADPNIEKLMDQAQIIARKGGGEARIRMSPEGLGEVHLRVVVKDGKVNVEMAAETKEAKKLLESSLSDLKLGLGGHKLSVESVKVDVGLQSSNDNQQQQKNPEFRQDQGRDQARQFFQNFRDENMGRREPFIEMPGIKAYTRSSRGPQPLQPVEESRARGDGRGERMNLVA